MKGEKVNDDESGEDEREKEVKREETVESSIVNTVTTSDEVDKILANSRDGGEKVSNDGSASVRHLQIKFDCTLSIISDTHEWTSL